MSLLSCVYVCVGSFLMKLAKYTEVEKTVQGTLCIPHLVSTINQILPYLFHLFLPPSLLPFPPSSCEVF